MGAHRGRGQVAGGNDTLGSVVAACCIMVRMSGVEAHRAAVGRALDALGLDWAAWPDVIVDPRLGSEARLSAVLVLLATSATAGSDGPVIHVVGREDSTVDPMGRQRGPWEQLAHLRLPWTASTATTALEVVRTGSYDDRRVSLALRGAGQVCASGHADVALLDALSGFTGYLDRVGEEQYRIREARAQVRRVVASAVPPELLDLSLLVDGDTWAGPAREAARAEPAEAVAPLVRLLSGLGPRKPSARWCRDIDGALEPAPARRVLRRWIELAAEAEVVPEWPGSDLASCLGTLFVHTNTDVVRAAVWATARIADEVWPVGPLGILARRGAAHNGLPGFPEALSLKVATAAVDVLIARGGEAERQALGELLEDLQRRDLLKKIGKSLDRQSEVAAREAELLTQRAREQRRKASPAPRKARAAVDSLIREHFGAELRTLGFTGGPRTWRRDHEGRLDVIAIGGGQDLGTGENRLDVAYGAYFDGAHPPGEPWLVERAKVRDHDLDVRIFDFDPFVDSPRTDDPFGAAYLAALVARIRDVTVPFLDTLGDYHAVRALLEADTGLPRGAALAGNLGSVARSRVLGMLGLHARDKTTAVTHLQRTLQWAESWAASEPHDGDPDNLVIAFYRAQLDRAVELA